MTARALPTLPLAPDAAPFSGTEPVEVADLDVLFRGFADPTRIRILNVLAAGELCVCDVVEILELPQPTVSRHLSYLRRSGLVTATRAWKFAHYRLAEPANVVHQNLVACVRACFTGVPALDRERGDARVRAAARATEAC